MGGRENKSEKEKLIRTESQNGARARCVKTHWEKATSAAVRSYFY